MTETRSLASLDCPACGARCMSAFAKMSLGPARSLACPSCGARVSVATLSSLLFCLGLGVLLVFVATYGMGVGGPLPTPAMRAWVVAQVVMISIPFCWLYARVIPLVVRRA
jgi:hypothetical protein